MSQLGEAWGAGKGNNLLKNAGQDGVAALQDYYGKAIGFQQPWQQGGANAMTYMQGLLGIGGDPAASQKAFDTYKDSTGYQFRMDQGTQAIDRSAAARGGLNSGATLKALERYGQGIGSQEFGNYLGYLNNLSGQGLNAATNMGNQAIHTGRGIADTNLTAAGARASGYQQKGSSYGNLLGGMLGGFL